MTTKWRQLIELRKAAGLSQYELARRLKIGRSALGNYEMGEREPDFETTKKIADYFGVSVDHLLWREEDITADSSARDVPPEWRHMVAQARADGYTPEQVIQALQLLESIRKQQTQVTKEEREG